MAFVRTEHHARRQRGQLQHNPLGDERRALFFCARYVEAVEVLRREIKERRAEMIQKGCMLRLDVDASRLFKFKEDGTVEVSKLGE